MAIFLLAIMAIEWSVVCCLTLVDRESSKMLKLDMETRIDAEHDNQRPLSQIVQDTKLLHLKAGTGATKKKSYKRKKQTLKRIYHHSQVITPHPHLISMTQYFKRQHGQPITEETLVQLGHLEIETNSLDKRRSLGNSALLFLSDSIDGQGDKEEEE